MRAARCEALLCGPPDLEVDPERFLLTVVELVRMAELDQGSLPAVVEDVALAVEATARGATPLRHYALSAAGVVLAAAREQRALRDVVRFMSACPRESFHADMNQGVEVVAAVECQIAAGPLLFPDGFPPAWFGTDFEAHGLVVGPASQLSLAVRWHGQNPAVLWEVTGDPITLSSPAVPAGWSSNREHGESLWVLDSHNLRA